MHGELFLLRMYLPFFFQPQSPFSNINISSTVLLKTFAIFNANTVDGTYLFASIALIVCLLTETLFARSSCVRLLMALSTLILFFIGHGFGVFMQDVIKPYNKYNQYSEHIVDHYIQKRCSIHKYKSNQ